MGDNDELHLEDDAQDDDEVPQEENVDNSGVVNPATARASAKRSHTRKANKLLRLHTQSAPQDKIQSCLEALSQAHVKFINAHNRYIASFQLNEEEEKAAALYLKNVQDLHDACVAQVDAAKTPSGLWTTSSTRSEVGDTPVNNAPANQNQQLGMQAASKSIVPTASNGPLHQSTPDRSIPPDDSLNNRATNNVLSDNTRVDLSQPDPSSEAKRIKLDLEFQLAQAKVRQQREQEDRNRQALREQEDIMAQIRRHEALISGFGAVAASNNLLSSTHQVAPSFQPQQYASGVSGAFENGPPNSASPYVAHAAQPPALYHSSHRWPKLAVSKFNGDPRGWTKYSHNISATIKHTHMPDPLKLLALQESLDEPIQRRMANVFAGGFTFQSAWLKSNQSMIIQAQSFRHMISICSKSRRSKATIPMASLRWQKLCATLCQASVSIT